ncbi:MAG TPA: InlB B-repeat-containing protein [Bacteroidales bacterium]|nr:InlB B-repeat-containing protein [Bacteroidales bacterium]
MLTQDTTLFAKWQPKPYIVSFETFGGNIISNATVTYNHLVNQPANPEKPGYQFDKWYKDSLFTVTWNFNSDLITENTTIYAKWIALSYNIHFDTNGGTPIEDTVVFYNSYINRPVNPHKNGYLFGGWFKNPNFTIIWNFENDVITANTTLYAKWISPDCTVHFETTGGTTINDTVVLYNNYINRPANPHKNGYLFDGWFKDPNFTIVWNFENDVITDNTTLYAKWIPVTAIHNEKKNEVIVYPVPTYNILHIKGVGFTMFELFDLSGKQVLKGRISESSTTTAVEMSSVKPGQYAILLSSRTGEKAIFKIIKK